MLIWTGAALAVLAAIVAAGPRVAVDTSVGFDPETIGADPEAYLRRSEAAVDGIRDGAQKQIVWADDDRRARTPLSLVYVHGFSASKAELRPVPDMVAAELGANIFYTRLAGHGMDGASLAEASVNDWINDYAEAVAIGRAIGEEVIVVATSTGAALASWAASEPQLSEGVSGLVLVSPNYRVRAAGARLLTWPWGGVLAEFATGRERGFEPLNELHGRYWTTRYPTRAILPMAAMAELARNAPVERIKIPAQFVYSTRDRVVDPDVTARIAQEWGAPATTIVVDDSGDPGHHVLAGDAVSPSTSGRVARAIADWITSLER